MGVIKNVKDCWNGDFPADMSSACKCGFRVFTKTCWTEKQWEKEVNLLRDKMASHRKTCKKHK